jgi:hypothetical protein
MKHDASAKSFLQKTPAENGVAKHFMGFVPRRNFLSRSNDFGSPISPFWRGRIPAIDQ